MSTFGFTLPSTNNQASGPIAEQAAILLGKDIYFDGDYSITPAGDFATVEGVDALRAAILRRLITRPGEFKVRPEYGVGVEQFVKKRRVQTTLDELRQRIVDQLSLDERIDEVRDVLVERITDGIKISVVVRVSGETLQFRPFQFAGRATLGTIAGPGGVGLRIRGE